MRVPSASRGYSRIHLTDDDDVTEPVAATDGRAVPAVMPELLLTLAQAEFRPVADRHHGVGLLGAQRPLLGRQSRDLAAYHVGAERHRRPGQREEVSQTKERCFVSK